MASTEEKKIENEENNAAEEGAAEEVAADEVEKEEEEEEEDPKEQLILLRRQSRILTEENDYLKANFNSERALRKRYYNEVEDMKGKIRVFCRVRPVASPSSASSDHMKHENIVTTPDDYTVIVDTPRGPKEFQYDGVFQEDHSQEKVFDEISRVIQSAVDGFNVCILAYGQLNTGKTYTMIGDPKQKEPGIIPRSFQTIFELTEASKNKFDFSVSIYMLELYRDNLIDLFGDKSKPANLEIKKNKKGMVVVQDVVIEKASSSEELMEFFKKGLAGRNTASTKQNAESSRSHLITSIIIESTNKTSGHVAVGKLNMVDLGAASNRVAVKSKSATSDTLKDAMAITKSLTALSDVISALTTGKEFVPYRNNKLTMLMQDSFGGNAKTLMFVNISPSAIHCDDTLTSLMYGSKVKLITNEAVKNADNEEIARLKAEMDRLYAERKKDHEELNELREAVAEAEEAVRKVDELTEENKDLENKNKLITDNFESERVLRKKYFNTIQDMKGKIRVYCRIRPLNEMENERKSPDVLSNPDEYTVAIKHGKTDRNFQCDAVYTSDKNQEHLFDDVQKLLQSALDGFNVCIFAYGQTGSGKTYTMVGDRGQKEPGIIPRSIKALYELMEQSSKKLTDFSISMSMLELYRDNLIDLLANGSAKPAPLNIKKDKNGRVWVQGSVSIPGESPEQLTAEFERCASYRHTGATKMNAKSSRSHMIVSLKIECKIKSSGEVLKGKLSFVDLAGSDKTAKAGGTGDQLKEGQAINKSLNALGDVVSALSSHQQHIPYRNDKLTLLMQDSIGGNAKTLMFVNVSPAAFNMEETITTLTYAERVKQITNGASRDSDNKEIARLKNIIAKLKKGEEVGEEEEE